MTISIHIFNFIYIAAIVLGGAVLTLSLILNAKEKDTLYKGAAVFVLCLFVYMLVDFTTYYWIQQGLSGSLVFLSIIASDILFYVLVTAWLHLIYVMAGDAIRVRFKTAFLITLIYLLCSQGLALFIGRYDSYSLITKEGVGKVILEGLNFSYVIFIFFLCGSFILYGARKLESGKKRSAVILFSALLMGYMVWIAIWDYQTFHEPERQLLFIYAIDPLILLYVVLNILVVYGFYKRDPLNIAGTKIAGKDAVEAFALRYNISKREKEVLFLINCGKSNGQIAAELFISENTVKRHINSIFKKTETASRYDLLSQLANLSSSQLIR
ncbi:MAG: helix-turn-helix transcriptional regulator [Anaerovoracaceae bacterium]